MEKFCKEGHIPGFKFRIWRIDHKTVYCKRLADYLRNPVAAVSAMKQETHISFI